MTQTDRLAADKPIRVAPDGDQVDAILDLLKRSFAFMDPRIDPPSSVLRLTTDAIRAQCERGEVWTLGSPPHACIFLIRNPDAIYIGKLAVDETMRGRGIARALVDLAEDRAKASGLGALELETRIELIENHEAFQRLGFVRTSCGTHEGFDRPTFVVMQKRL